MEAVPFQVYAMKEPNYVMSLTSTYGTNQCSGKETTRELVDGSGTAKKPNSIILKWLETTSCTDTPSTTTTINNTHLLVWRLFGQQSIGQTESSASSSASLK